MKTILSILLATLAAFVVVLVLEIVIIATLLTALFKAIRPKKKQWYVSDKGLVDHFEATELYKQIK